MRRFVWSTLLALLAAVSVVAGYEVSFADSDYSRQVCSGMWGGSNTYINGTPSSNLHVQIFISRWRQSRSTIEHPMVR